MQLLPFVPALLRAIKWLRPFSQMSGTIPRKSYPNEAANPSRETLQWTPRRNRNKVSGKHNVHLGKPGIILKQKTSKGSSCWTKGNYSSSARKRHSPDFPFLWRWLRWVWCTRAPHHNTDVHDLDLPNPVWAPTSQVKRTEIPSFTLHPIYKLPQTSLRLLKHLARRWNSALPQGP